MVITGIFQQVIHVTGTLSANVTVVYTAPCDCQLLHVSAVGTGSNAGKIKIGTTSSTEAYLEDADIGVSSVPVEKVRTDFVGDQYPDISDGDIVQITITDHASHCADVTVVLTFAAG